VIRLPLPKLALPEWPAQVLQQWTETTGRAANTSRKAGHSDVFERMVAAIGEMIRTGRYEGLNDVISRRPGARALTMLWLQDAGVRRRLLSMRTLDTLLKLQSPRLTRISLLNLVSLYLREFDQLDEGDGSSGLRAHLQLRILEQLELLPDFRALGDRADPLHTLKLDGHWLLELDGPKRLARQTRESGSELAETLARIGFSGMDAGRYGEICRAHFYLSVLQELSPGQWDPVLDELLKPSVAKAPFQGELRIGHAVLSILIDRASGDPGELWQNFILNLAGDPRVAMGAPKFRQWWGPLGAARIEKVRAWMSKEDLRLFLHAVEMYGEESGKVDLKRMFPARKVFLEGLYRLGYVRQSRLMLGSAAQTSVRRILGAEVKTNFATLEGALSDKAVIYLDCGEFCLIEGSHSFKFWLYLEPPSPRLTSYEVDRFTQTDLTLSILANYQKQHPGYQYDSVIHLGLWQHKVFEFLTEHGINLDLEQLLTRADYRALLAKHGRPIVSPAALGAKETRLARRAYLAPPVELPDILSGTSAQ